MSTQNKIALPSTAADVIPFLIALGFTVSEEKAEQIRANVVADKADADAAEAEAEQRDADAQAKLAAGTPPQE